MISRAVAEEMLKQAVECQSIKKRKSLHLGTKSSIESQPKKVVVVIVVVVVFVVFVVVGLVVGVVIIIILGQRNLNLKVMTKLGQ